MKKCDNSRECFSQCVEMTAIMCYTTAIPVRPILSANYTPLVTWESNVVQLSEYKENNGLKTAEIIFLNKDDNTQLILGIVYLKIILGTANFVLRETKVFQNLIE